MLALEIACRRNTITDLPLFEAPPVLRRGWELLVRLSACQPQLIRPDSLPDRISTRLWSRGTWLVWETPPTLQRSSAPSQSQHNGDASAKPSLTRSVMGTAVTKVLESAEKIGLSDLLSSTILDRNRSTRRSVPGAPSSSLDDLAKNSPLLAELIWQLPGVSTVSIASMIAEAIPMLRDKGYAVVKSSLERLGGELGNRLDELISGPGLEDLCRKAQLGQSERFYIVGQINLARSRQTTSMEPYALETLVKQLDLPASQIALLAAGLVTKLTVVFARDSSSRGSSG